MKVTFEDVRKNKAVNTYIEKADESLIALGYTDHSFSHVNKVSKLAGDILTTLGYSGRETELARISGYLHDIGNVINRIDTSMCTVMDYFEIFLERMILCHKAAEKLGIQFWLVINGQRMI